MNRHTDFLKFISPLRLQSCMRISLNMTKVLCAKQPTPDQNSGCINEHVYQLGISEGSGADVPRVSFTLIVTLAAQVT